LVPTTLGLLSAIVFAGCRDAQPQKSQPVAKARPERTEPEEQQAEQKPPKPLPGVQIGKNVSLEVNGDSRRVLINAVVCFRMGLLEQFLCRAGTKEHESILAADIDARQVHAALIAAGAEPGSPVKFQP